jgi:hypothetical protein
MLDVNELKNLSPTDKLRPADKTSVGLNLSVGDFCISL